MSRIFADYIERARDILDNNWTGSSTKPAPSLYPHQWNWDTGFIAIGRSHYDTVRAIQEIESLFDAQWTNGMVPQIVFNPEELGHYFPEPDFWQTERSPYAPAGKLTSGITMPPIHAVAVEKIYQNARQPRSVRPFLERMYPKLLELEEAAKSFVNSSEVLVLPEEGKMLISEIFRWYEKDFGGKGGVIDFIFDYLVGENARHFIRENSLNLPIEYLHYDWYLNR